MDIELNYYQWVLLAAFGLALLLGMFGMAQDRIIPTKFAGHVGWYVIMGPCAVILGKWIGWWTVVPVAIAFANIRLCNLMFCACIIVGLCRAEWWDTIMIAIVTAFNYITVFRVQNLIRDKLGEDLAASMVRNAEDPVAFTRDIRQSMGKTRDPAAVGKYRRYEEARELWEAERRADEKK